MDNNTMNTQNSADEIISEETQTKSEADLVPETYDDTDAPASPEEENPEAADTGDTNEVAGEEIEVAPEEDERTETQAITEQPDEYVPGAQNFVTNLPYMGKGMLAIFVVIGVIMAVTALLNKIFKK